MVRRAACAHPCRVSIRIALVDDHAQFRSYLATALSRQRDFAVVLQACDGPSAVRALAACGGASLPDVLLIDVDMPNGGGIAATRRILRDHPGLRIIAVSMHDDPRLVDAVLAAGASAYVIKGEPLVHLLAAIRGRQA
jgi:DNA-binding NarL/FixJ family response regulator